jgi:hypothetical protein
VSSEDTAREQLHAAIQGTNQTDQNLEGAMLMGWVVVAEWMAPDGERWLSRVDGTAARKGCPEWQREGYLHNALYSGGFEAFEGSDDGEEEDSDDS